MGTVKCPVCKGQGKYDVPVDTYQGVGRPLIRSVLSGVVCHLCDGAKVITEKKAAELAAEKKLWCQCPEPSDPQVYHPDGTSKVCRKHHWTCGRCGKITQVG